MKTKFELNDEVYIIHNNKIQCVRINSIILSSDKKIIYSLENSGTNRVNRYEDEVFKDSKHVADYLLSRIVTI